VPEGYTAFTVQECNDDAAQYITTVAKILDMKQTQFQKVMIGENKWWGRTMWVDDVLNVTERDEFIYHELLVHVPVMIHPNPTRVLIIGGGDGGSARELLKHPNLTNATMIDIDEELCRMCEKHMPKLSNGAFTDPNLNLIFGDGIDFVKKAEDNSFDVIIVDSTDPLPGSVGEVLFTKEFYEHCYRVLSPNGTISTQALMPMRYDPDIYRRALTNIQHAFGKDNLYVYFAPTDSYSGCTSFCLGFKGDSHPTKIDKPRIKEFIKEAKLRYYNYGMHKGSFRLPGYVREMLYPKAE
jgi:spermidine synthase